MGTGSKLAGKRYKRAMRLEHFRAMELKAADEILEHIMSKLGMQRKEGSFEPAVHISDSYVVKLRNSEKARRKIWREFGAGHVDMRKHGLSYRIDDAAFDGLESDIDAVRRIYLAAISTCRPDDIPVPPGDADEKTLFSWIAEMRKSTGADYMLSAYFDENVPLEYITAGS